MAVRSGAISIIAVVLGLALVLPSAAEAAKKNKGKKRVAAPVTVQSARTPYWGTDLVRAGPLYNGPDYLGDDPDPNIRSQILRDLTGRYGGIN